MKVTLRQRNQGGKTSLYLDFYDNGKRKREYLKLYLEPNPKTKVDRNLNKQTLALAESIKAKKQIEIQNGTYDFYNSEVQKGSFINYVQKLTDQRFNSTGNYGNWLSMLKHLKNYCPNGITFKKLDENFVTGFKEYLDTYKKESTQRGLSQNSKLSYFNKFRAAIKQALKEKIIVINPLLGISGFKEAETQREFLTLEELQTAAITPCEIPRLKDAFLFSSLTGLRHSDIQKLTWQEVQHSNEMGYYIRYTQQKTTSVETLPISEPAYKLLGERGEYNEIVFKGLKYSAWHNQKLQDWITSAGINKKITFHCARHTFSTLQLTLGTDIYTIKELLGHKDIRTTQLYSKVINQKKKDAANMIKL